MLRRRVGEVHSLQGADVKRRRLTIRHPNTGFDEGDVFMPETPAARLKAYVEAQNIPPSQSPFPI